MTDDQITEAERIAAHAETVQCPDCMAPVNVSCGDQPHADRIRAADLRVLEHGRCALCGQPMVRGSVEGAPVDAWHPDEVTAAGCPRIPDPQDDWEGYATATDLGLTPGHPGVENFVPLDAIEDAASMNLNEVVVGDGSLRATFPGLGVALPTGPDGQVAGAQALRETVQALVDAGYGTHEAVMERLTKAASDPITEPLATTYPRPLYCPECANGKCVNCVGQALDPVTDDLVPCACTHGAT